MFSFNSTCKIIGFFSWIPRPPLNFLENLFFLWPKFFNALAFDHWLSTSFRHRSFIIKVNKWLFTQSYSYEYVDSLILIRNCLNGCRLSSLKLTYWCYIFNFHSSFCTLIDVYIYMNGWIHVRFRRNKFYYYLKIFFFFFLIVINFNFYHYYTIYYYFTLLLFSCY